MSMMILVLFNYYRRLIFRQEKTLNIDCVSAVRCLPLDLDCSEQVIACHRRDIELDVCARAICLYIEGK
jgi:hypothetical protein